MSVTRLTYLHCDGKDCIGASPFEIDPDPNESTGRERARQSGWLVSQIGGKDYCPECRKKVKSTLGPKK